MIRFKFSAHFNKRDNTFIIVYEYIRNSNTNNNDNKNLIRIKALLFYYSKRIIKHFSNDTIILKRFTINE